MAYSFEWDLKKAASNLKDHGVSFDEATTVFGDILAITAGITNWTRRRRSMSRRGSVLATRLGTMAKPRRKPNRLRMGALPPRYSFVLNARSRTLHEMPELRYLDSDSKTRTGRSRRTSRRAETRSSEQNMPPLFDVRTIDRRTGNDRVEQLAPKRLTETLDYRIGDVTGMLSG